MSAVALALMVAAAVAAPGIAPADPQAQDLQFRLARPTWLIGAPLMLGADHLGRDVLSRIVWGARASLAMGLLAVFVGGVVGTVLGVVSGYWGSWVDHVIMTAVDIQMAFPFILLAIALIAVLGPSFATLVIVVGLSGWVTFARVVRGQVLSLKAREFIEGARAAGAGHVRILVRHILPNAASPLIVVATLELARILVLESSLSFLGLGIQPPTPSWGGMLRDGREHVANAWWVATFPGTALLMTCLCVNRIGDSLRDLLDPQARTDSGSA
jgi:peptide/nickel transport system permease protein